jgi:ribonuclease D
LFEPALDELTHKLGRGGRLDGKGYGALRELLRWREARVRQLNLPRRWIADDAVLVDLAHVRPKDLSHLATFRGLNRGELKNSGEAILAALSRGTEVSEPVAAAGEPGPRPEKGSPEGRRREKPLDRSMIPSAEESQVLDLLKCYVGILADRHRIAAKHLMTSAQLLPLLRAQAGRLDDLVQSGLLGKQAALLIGEDLLAFLRGERALSIDRSRIKVIPLDAGSGKT